MAGTPTGPAVAVDQRSKTVWFAANDRDHQRQSESAGANEGVRRSSNTEPNRERVLERARINSLPGKGRAMPARPMNMRVLTNVQKQLELLGKKRIVVIQVEAKERKRVAERAASGNTLCCSVRKQIKRQELLKSANGMSRVSDAERACDTRAAQWLQRD